VLEVKVICQVCSPQGNQSQYLLNSRLLSEQIHVHLTQIAGSRCCSILEIQRCRRLWPI